MVFCTTEPVYRTAETRPYCRISDSIQVSDISDDVLLSYKRDQITPISDLRPSENPVEGNPMQVEKNDDIQ